MVASRMEEVSRLRDAVADIAAGARGRAALPFGVPELDGRLAAGGLDAAALHDVAPAAPLLADEAAATLFAAGVAARASAARASPALWAVTRFDLYAPGLEQAGLGPAAVLFLEAREDRDVLAAMEDALRRGSVACVVGEVRRADMTATRRLQLAAAEGGVPALLLRRWRRSAASPLDVPSSAATRWRVGCAPSAPLGHPGVGRPRWTVELARQRNGPGFTILMEGCDAQGRLAPAAAPRDRAAAAAGADARAA